jgi:hypothetical protein
MKGETCTPRRHPTLSDRSAILPQGGRKYEADLLREKPDPTLEDFTIDYEKEKGLSSLQGKIMLFPADIEESRSMIVPSVTSNPICSVPFIIA